MLAQLKMCQDYCLYYRKHGKQYCHQQLRERAARAWDDGNVEAEKQILAIIRQESERAFWRCVEYVMKKQSGSSVRVVQVENEDRELVEFATQEEVHESIWSNIHRKRFYLVEEVPICNAPMREVFGYNVDSEFSEEVLEGRFKFEENLDEHTRDVLQAVAHTQGIIPQDLVDDIIWPGDWGSFWGPAWEETSSSELGLHLDITRLEQT